MAQGPGSGGNVLAALCSLFVPGLGQLLQGRILAALLFFIAMVLFWSLFVFLWFAIFWIGPVVHLWSAVDAARFRPRY
jgi:TM2 domain-containing membrane protein YozV